MAQVNYLAAAKALNYTGGFSSLGHAFDYASLTWLGSPILKVALDTAYLELMRSQKIAEVSAEMNIEMISGFLSDALEPGVFRKYDSDLQGQIVAIGALVYCSNTGTPTFTVSSVDLVSGVREYHPHTVLQLTKLLGDIGAGTAVGIQKLQTKIAEILSVNTGNVTDDLDTIAAISWT